MKLNYRPMKAIVIIPMFLYAFFGFSQGREQWRYLNTVTSSVPFLVISADAAQAGVGDIGVVGTQGGSGASFNSNPALLVSKHRFIRINNSYSPWHRSIVPGKNLFSNSVAFGPTNRDAIEVQFKMFKYDMALTDPFGNPISSNKANEFCIQANYAHRWDNGLSYGMAFKYVHSDITNGRIVGGVQTHPGHALAADIGLTHQKELLAKDRYNMELNSSFALNNIGSKISYIKGNTDFIPMRMLIGANLKNTFDLDENQLSYTFSYQVSKYLIPSPPAYQIDSNGMTVIDNNSNPVLASGYDPQISVPIALIQSFYDAPGKVSYDENFNPSVKKGSRASEEFHEYIHQVGSELKLKRNENLAISLRQGLFLKHDTKGARRFISFGIGLEVHGLTVDVTTWRGIGRSTVLNNSLFFNLGYIYNFNKAKD